MRLRLRLRLRRRLGWRLSLGLWLRLGLRLWWLLPRLLVPGLVLAAAVPWTFLLGRGRRRRRRGLVRRSTVLWRRSVP